MEIILNDLSYEAYVEEEDFIKKFEKDLKSFDKNAKWQSADIGRGADWPVILAIFSIIISIPGNIFGFIKLSNEFKKFLTNLKKKYGQVRICEECASLLALNYINSKEKVVQESINIYSKTIPVGPPVKEKKSGHLDDKPECFYIQIYEINKYKYYLFVIKSNGTFELKHYLNIPKWYEF